MQPWEPRAGRWPLIAALGAQSGEVVPGCTPRVLRAGGDFVPDCSPGVLRAGRCPLIYSPRVRGYAGRGILRRPA